MLAGLAALPFLFLTSVNYLDYTGQLWTEGKISDARVLESAFCALVDSKVYYI